MIKHIRSIFRTGKYLGFWLVSGSLHAAADPSDTWQPYVSETITYDDNLFRLSKDANPRIFLGPGRSKEDVVSRLTAGSKINYEFGRQKLLLDLAVDDNRFVNNDGLDHVSTNDQGTLKWELGKYLTGDLGYGYRHYLGSFQNTQFYVKDMIDDNNAFIDVNFAWHPRWRLRTGGRWFQSIHSAEIRSILDVSRYTGILGFDYVSPSRNTAGLEYRYTEADLPNRQPSIIELIDNHYREHNVLATTQWSISPLLRVEGNIGYTSREHQQFSERNYSGETWQFSLNWSPTDNTLFSLATWRELRSAQDLTASYFVSEGVSLSPAWSITQKLSLTTKVGYEKRNYAGDPRTVITDLPQRRDEGVTGLVMLSYMPLRWTELNLAYQTEHRDSNYRYRDYTYNSVFATAKLKF